MKIENEITVLVNSSYEELHKKLLNYNFIIKEEYQVDDNYMINSSYNLKNIDKLDILKECILIRNIEDIKKVLLYKYKKYDNNGDILEQGKVECPITDIARAINFMNAINYKKLFTINDKCIVYVNDRTELTVQLVNNKYIFIEMEDKCNFINKKYESITELKNELEMYDLPYDKNNYFVKKALIILNELES